ncbi:type VII toxin-antitoxin system HepT family RNase toxin [Desulfuribacillus alkaliarsenatis]|uniref:DUF86 domain-containing protein n=1 Tax=Desulfuribacillus alkaliarsenatis TaxID=766136 RepID=A0A1E5FZE8_9FIRM|nr:DUF86 domain-containing protein [Desulfuribacillus alkaliarsenatis]OEF95945.1 hypothetical protein BHF68_11180 [Desulfuribacillus alkaliarsenatis]
MVNSELVKRKIAYIDECIKKINKYSNYTYQQFAQDDIVQDVVEYNLFQAINLMIDIAQHVVTDGDLGKPEKLSDGFEILFAKKYITERQLFTYKNMVGFRNIIAHQYTSLDKKIVYTAMNEKVKDIKEFVSFVLEDII